MLGIRCDRYGCGAEIWCLPFDGKPQGWKIVDLGLGDHMDYCPEHVRTETHELS